ncbi:MAG: sulfite exporter TauE/SafE family protein [Microbacterium gubbeenense]|uniref:sulfite exporter TauE/SafE family protein n=1 Tax=Microbacterium gubbeenense TaxID=159896 RepID=UPI003F98EBD1
MNAVRARGPRAILTFVAIGLVSGFMSGLFGVGGGTVIVPLLVTFALFSQKIASGTSGASIVVTAAIGVIAYAAQDEVDWIAGLLLAAGGIAGAQIGAHLLHVIRETVVRWIFVGFIAVMIVTLFLVVPERGAGVPLDAWLAVALVGIGVVTGILSGLIGVGGGVIVVPVLIVLFGTSDLVAKGTSLLMMIPTTISGALRNAKNGNVDFVAAGAVAAATLLTTPLGVLVAALLDPSTANLLFIAFLVVIGVQMALKAIRGRRSS